MVADEECNYAGKILPTIRYTVKIQARCSLVEIVRLFDEMRFKGIYDSTTIVLVADHGTFAKAKGIKGSVDDDGNYAGNLDARVISLAHPLMVIKLANEAGPLVTSSVYSSITDTPATIASALHLDAAFSGRSILELAEGKSRLRRHYYYKHDDSQWNAEYLSLIQEFIVDGSVLDTGSWRLARKFYGKGAIE